MGVVAVVCLVAACSDPDKERLKQTTKATYDQKTGRLKELTYDANKNGRIDTWTDMDGTRPLRARIDRNEDGKLDRWEYYDDKGQLAKVGFSRSDDGKPDAWAFSGPDGKVVRIEISSAKDENKIDRSGALRAQRCRDRKGSAPCSRPTRTPTGMAGRTSGKPTKRAPSRPRRSTRIVTAGPTAG